MLAQGCFARRCLCTESSTLQPRGQGRRLKDKQPPPQNYREQPSAVLALRRKGEAADGLVALKTDARRQHVHYTHVRTHSATDVQLDTISHEEFWQHLLRCYREAYPDAASPTGSILRFGLVVKELHNDAPHDAGRSVHHHARRQFVLSILHRHECLFHDPRRKGSPYMTVFRAHSKMVT